MTKIAEEEGKMPGGKHTHRPIPMAPGYFVIETGVIFSASGWRGIKYRRLVSGLNDDGYPSVRLVIGGKHKSISVHRLVANVFLPPRPSRSHEIRHLDGNKMNSCADNLAWGTRADNAADREKHGKTSRGPRHSAAIRASNQANGTRAFRARQRAEASSV